MTALSLERLVHPRRATTPRTGTAPTTRTTLIGESIRAARDIDNVVSPSAQLRVMERFAARIDR
jgi:hypothetical protein